MLSLNFKDYQEKAKQAAELMEDMAEKGQGEFMGDLMQRKVRSDLQEQNLPKKNTSPRRWRASILNKDAIRRHSTSFIGLVATIQRKMSILPTKYAS